MGLRRMRWSLALAVCALFARVAGAEEVARPVWRLAMSGLNSSEECGGECAFEANPWIGFRPYLGVDGPGIPQLGIELMYVPLVRRDARIGIRHTSAAIVVAHDVTERHSLGGALGAAWLRGEDVDTDEPVLFKRGLDLGARYRYAALLGDRYRLDLGLELDVVATGEGSVWMGGFELAFGRR